MEKRKKAKQVQDKYFNHLMKKGHQAGMVAENFKGFEPKTLVVDEGVCGFAWIEINPATGAFTKWVKKNRERFGGQWHKQKYYMGATGMDFGIYNGYPKGLHMGVRLFGQGMTRKAAYCAGFANVLREAGINAYANNRMD